MPDEQPATDDKKWRPNLGYLIGARKKRKKQLDEAGLESVISKPTKKPKD
jgi:hypothetical protein